MALQVPERRPGLQAPIWEDVASGGPLGFQAHGVSGGGFEGMWGLSEGRVSPCSQEKLVLHHQL